MPKNIRIKNGELPNNNCIITRAERAELTRHLRERQIIGISYFRKGRTILPKTVAAAH